MMTSTTILAWAWIALVQVPGSPAARLSGTPEGLTGSEQVIGAAVALLILKEVFEFVRGIVQKGGVGDRRRDQGDEYRLIFAEVLAATVMPILQQQADILGQLRATQLTNGDRLLKLQYTADETKESTAAARASLHRLHDGVQALPGAVIQLQRAGGRG